MTLTIDESFDLETAALTDAERGRLLLCMQRYAAKGEEMELTGNERFLWPVYRCRIDKEKRISAARAEAGRRGGEANKSKGKQTEANFDLLSGHENNEKEKGTQKEKEKESERVTPPLSSPHSAEQRAAAALFDRFWAAYPRKEDKKNALRAFLRLKPTEGMLETMLAAVERQRSSRQWLDAGGQYIPKATTWLNGERWMDQAFAGPPGRAVGAQMYGQREYTREELDGVGEDLFAQARAMSG